MIAMKNVLYIQRPETYILGQLNPISLKTKTDTFANNVETDETAHN